MAYEVIARKWRPQKFSDVVGQDHVTQTLGNAIKSERTAHAYLFVGSRGIGKTTIARIFAKALNCEKGPAEEPCCECNSCKEIAAGSSMDVVEIDGASNNGVDQIRDLRETVKYAPNGTYKIYIIDEVHMLSAAAFNALLKTLEEPPPFVKFMFATTEPQKILATIISRCQRFDLRRIPVGLIIDRLKLIAKADKVSIEEDALLAIARGAEGGMRDAQSALDQLISFRGNSIKEEDVLSVFGLVSRSKLETLAEKILAGDIKSLITTIAELDESGKDLQRVLIELVGHFRNLLIALNVDDDFAGLDFTESQIKVLKEQAVSADTGRVMRVCAMLSQAEDKMKYALSRRTVLEMALIRAARASVVVSIDEVLKKINELKASGGVIQPAAPLEDDVKKNVKQVAPAEIQEPAVVKETPEELPVEEPVESSAEVKKLQLQWHDVIERVSKSAPLAKSVLIDAIPLSINGDKVIVGFDPEFADEIESFKGGRNKKALERVLKTILGREIELDIVLDANVSVKREEVSRMEPEPVEDEEESDSDEGDKGSGATDKPASAGAKGMHEWMQDKTVRKALEVFDGTILDVRE